jgi:hypothetical protein
MRRNKNVHTFLAPHCKGCLSFVGKIIENSSFSPNYSESIKNFSVKKRRRMSIPQFIMNQVIVKMNLTWIYRADNVDVAYFWFRFRKWFGDSKNSMDLTFIVCSFLDQLESCGTVPNPEKLRLSRPVGQLGRDINKVCPVGLYDRLSFFWFYYCQWKINGSILSDRRKCL